MKGFGKQDKAKTTKGSKKKSNSSKAKIINQALRYHIEGNTSEALKYYKSYFKKGFKDYKVYSNYGILLKEIGKLEEAEVSQRKAIKYKPDFATAHSNLGNILKELGKIKEAELSTRKAIELDPNFANAHANLGNILIDQGKLEEAELSTRKAIELNPDLDHNKMNKGLELNDLEEIQVEELNK